ncbi:MAG: MarR family winged helix-turn-helix transcriptional regulator [Kineosporiaceae bacterium]
MNPDPSKEAPMDAAALLAVELGRFARLHHTIKMHLSAQTPGGLEWAAMGVLGDVIKRGPLRQTELAVCSLLDQSTVSRHVAALVKAGLVERRPDPADGRASLLAATAEGLDSFARFAGQRTHAVGRMVAHWERDDVERLTGYLKRLVDEFEERRPEALAALAQAHHEAPPVDLDALRAVLGIPAQPTDPIDVPAAPAATGPTLEH